MSEVVVIGAGLGGLSAAIHARLAGHSVLVLESGERVGGKAAPFVEHGYRLDPGPSIVILTRVYGAVFRAAGREMDDYVRFRRLDPFTRVCFEGVPPLDLPADGEACLDVLASVAPEDAAALRDLLERMDRAAPHIDASVFHRPYDRAWQLADPHLIAFARRFDVTRSYKQVVDRMFRSPLLRAFFYGFPSYGGQTYDSKAPGALMIPYLMVREGVWWPEGGIGAIPAAFERLARELGVEFRFGARVAGLKDQGDRVTCAVLTSGEEVRAEAFISNVDRLTTRDWLGIHDSPPPSLSYFTVHLGVRRRIEGLSHHTLLVPKDFERGFEELYRRRRFPDPPIVYLNATHLEAPETAPEGCSNLFAVVTSPAIEPHLDWAGEQDDLARRVEGELSRFGFGFDPGDVEVRRVQTPLTFQARHGNYLGSLYGPDERYRLWGMMPLRVQDERYRNLLYAGGSVQPGAGMPMVVLSGRFAAERVP